MLEKHGTVHLHTRPLQNRRLVGEAFRFGGEWIPVCQPAGRLDLNGRICLNWTIDDGMGGKRDVWV